MQFTENHISITDVSHCTVKHMDVGRIDHTWHERESDCFAYYFTGSVEYVFQDRSFTVGAKDILYLSKGASYEMLIKENADIIYVDFEIARDGDNPFASGRYSMRNSTKAEALFTRLVNSWIYQSELSKLKCTSAVYEIILDVAEQTTRAYLAPKSQKYIDETVDYIERNYHNPNLGIEDLTGITRVSAVHLRRLYKGYLGVSPSRYISHVRLKRARELLRDTSESVGAIARLTGYESIYYFCRAFKEATGFTPTEYRRLRI